MRIDLILFGAFCLAVVAGFVWFGFFLARAIPLDIFERRPPKDPPRE